MNLRKHFLCFATAFLFLSQTSLWAQSECIQVRAALDIGSGATKLKVAKVNHCEKKIEQVLLSTSRAVGYRQAVETSVDNTIDSPTLESGLLALKELKELAQKYNPVSFGAVATSAFRTAGNGEEAAKYLSEKTGIVVNVIDQKREAFLGYLAAIRSSGIDEKDAIVWDIGGGSMQLSFVEKKQETKGYDHLIYEGKIASVSFKNHIIQDIQMQEDETVLSPNPIGIPSAKMGKRDAMVVAKFTVPAVFREKIRKGATVLGIGGVHAYSISGQLKKREFTLSDLDRAILIGVHRSDDEIESEYAETEISNLILVSAFMQELGMRSVKALDVNLADGVLLLD